MQVHTFTRTYLVSKHHTVDVSLDRTVFVHILYCLVLIILLGHSDVVELLVSCAHLLAAAENRIQDSLF